MSVKFQWDTWHEDLSVEEQLAETRAVVEWLVTELFEIGDALEKNIRFLEDYMNGPGGNAGPAELRKLLNWMIAEKDRKSVV